MATKFLTAAFRSAVALSAVIFALSLAGQAQQQVSMALLHPTEVFPAANVTAAPVEPLHYVQPLEPKAATTVENHHFWDRENSMLFAGTLIGATGDFIVTRNNLRNGGVELNPVARVFSGSTAGLAANFAGETAGVTTLSYIFHKTGHHRLERLAPMVNLSASGYAIAYGLSHR